MKPTARLSTIERIRLLTRYSSRRTQIPLYIHRIVQSYNARKQRLGLASLNGKPIERLTAAVGAVANGPFGTSGSSGAAGNTSSASSSSSCGLLTCAASSGAAAGAEQGSTAGSSSGGNLLNLGKVMTRRTFAWIKR